MKWILLFATSLLVGACNTTIHSSDSKELEVAEQNDSVQRYCIYNDSVDNILMHSSNVKLYQMFSLIRDSVDASQKDSLFIYPIKKKLGKLKKEGKHLLHFIISDTKQYRTNYTPIRQPFNPDFALEFTKGKQTAYYFVSFGTGEIAIADITGHFKFFLMSDAHTIERWYDNILIERTKTNPKK